MVSLCLVAVLAVDAQFRIRDGKPVKGEIVGLEKLTLETPYGEVRIPLAHAWHIRCRKDRSYIHSASGVFAGKLALEHFEVRTRFGLLKITKARIRDVFMNGRGPEPRADPLVILSGGCRVRGRPFAETLRLDTRYGALDIPFDKIQDLRRDGDEFRVSVGGKELKGQVPDRAWTLVTPYGPLRFRTAAIEQISSAAVPKVGDKLQGGHVVMAVERFRGHTYLHLQRPGGTDWDAASSIAKLLVGYLASIEDEEENAFLFKLAMRNNKGSCWIGLHDISNEGKWQWSSLEKVEYTNWDRGEPNNANDEDGVEMRLDRDGRWNDIQLTQRNRGGCLIELDR